MTIAFTVSPVGDGYAVEHIEFTQDDRKITFVNQFDVYTIFTFIENVEDGMFEQDAIINYNPKKGINTAIFGWTSEEEGERIKYNVKGAEDKDEKKELIEAFDYMYESGVEDLGWEWSDRDLYFFGPFEVTDTKTGIVTVYGKDS